MDNADDVLFDYLARGNPKSNEDLKRRLRRHPRFREEIGEFTPTWRTLSILKEVLPPAPPDPAVERRLIRRARPASRHP